MMSTFCLFCTTFSVSVDLGAFSISFGCFGVSLCKSFSLSVVSFSVFLYVTLGNKRQSQCKHWGDEIKLNNKNILWTHNWYLCDNVLRFAEERSKSKCCFIRLNMHKHMTKYIRSSKHSLFSLSWIRLSIFRFSIRSVFFFFSQAFHERSAYKTFNHIHTHTFISSILFHCSSLAVRTTLYWRCFCRCCYCYKFTISICSILNCHSKQATYFVIHNFCVVYVNVYIGFDATAFAAFVSKWIELIELGDHKKGKIWNEDICFVNCHFFSSTSSLFQFYWGCLCLL